MTLADLDEKIQREETLGDVVLSVADWAELSASIGLYQFVQATPDRPAYFWFLDRRILTPAASGHET